MPNDIQSPMLRKALGLAALGYRVFPCDPKLYPDDRDKEKAPLIKANLKLATSKPLIIRQWWARWPDALVGVRTGYGAACLDFDYVKHPEARAPHDDMETLGMLDGAPSYETRSGARHCWFKSLGGNRKLKALPGIDVLDGNCYAICWGDLPVALADLPGAPPELLAMLKLSNNAPANDAPNSQSTAAPRAAPSMTGAQVVEALKDMDANCDRSQWVLIGMDIAAVTGGSNKGYAAFDTWSASATVAGLYSKARTVTEWASYKRALAAGKLTYRGTLDLAAGPEAFDDLPDEGLPKIDDDPQPTPAPAGASDKQKADALDKGAAWSATKFLNARLLWLTAEKTQFDYRDNVMVDDRSVRNLYTSHMPRLANGKRMNPVDVFAASRRKIKVTSRGFKPGAPVVYEHLGLKYANTWRTDGIAPAAGTPEEVAIIEWLFERIEDRDFRNWLRQWMAYIYQHPSGRPFAVPFLWSETNGNGKSTLLEIIPRRLVGHVFAQDNKLGQSNFNEHAIATRVMHLAELCVGNTAERKDFAARTKQQVTGAWLQIHPKGKSAYQIPNFMVMTATSNEPNALEVAEGDRRWAVYEMTGKEFTADERKRVYGFLGDDQRATTAAGAAKIARATAVLRHYFGKVDLSDFEPEAPAPQTQSKRELIEAGEENFKLPLREAFSKGSEPFDKGVMSLGDVKEWLDHKKVFVTPNMLGRFLKGDLKLILRDVKPGDGGRVRLYVKAGSYWAACSLQEAHDQWRKGGDDFEVLE